MSTELRHLEQFIAVAETKSFTAAANRLGVVQSSVSVGVQALEREMRSELLERTSRRVALTQAGEALLPHAYAVRDAINAGQDAVQAVGGGLTGVVKVGSFGSVELTATAQVLATCRLHQPDVSVRLRSWPDATGALEALSNRSVDLALLPIADPMPDGLEIVPLESESMAVLLSPRDDLARHDRLSLQHLRDREFVDTPVGHGVRAAVDRTWLRAGRTRNVMIEVPDAPTMAGYVRAGLGIAIVPPSFIADLGGDLLVKELHPIVTWSAGVAFLKGRHLGPAASAVLAQFRSLP